MIELLNIDCMEYMAGLKYKTFDLAIVDPPYGIGNSLLSGDKRDSKFTRDKDTVHWDVKPSFEYFIELERVSVHQIIWGANYFLDHLRCTKCFLMWDKIQEFSGSDFELAWTSFNRPSKAFRMSRVEAHSNGTIHPMEKPVKLYRWLLHNYAGLPGQRILDTHLGSGSSAIAAHNMGFDFVGCEIDKEYYDAACKRFKEQTAQLKLL